MIVPVAPGGTTDLLGRLLGQRFTDAVGQPVVVENRAGGAMVVGTDLVAKSAPDGHTLGILLSTHTVNAVAVPNLPYDSVRDFTPIAHLANFPGVLTVHPSIPVRSVAEFIAYARANPGKLSYGMPGPGTSGHLTMELLKVIDRPKLDAHSASVNRLLWLDDNTLVSAGDDRRILVTRLE